MGADKSSAQPTSRCHRTELIVSLERGVCSCAELQLSSCYRGWKEACQATCAISTTSGCELSSSFFLQGKVLNEIHVILTETLRYHAPSYATIKNWVAQFKRGDYSTSNARRLERAKTVSTPEIIDQIHELILEDRRISAKSLAEQLGIYVSGLGPSFMQIWTCRSSPRGGSRNAWTRIKNVNSASHLSNFWKFSAWSKWFPLVIGDHGRNLVISLWPADKATTNGVGAYWLTSPKRIPSAKIRWKSARLNFLDQSILLIDYLPKGQTINTEYCSSLLMQLKDILKEERRKVTKMVLFLHDTAPARQALANQKKVFLISNFRCVLNVVCFLLGYSRAS